MEYLRTDEARQKQLIESFQRYIPMNKAYYVVIVQVCWIMGALRSNAENRLLKFHWTRQQQL